MDCWCVMLQPCDLNNHAIAACIDSVFLPRPAASSYAQCRPPVHRAPRDVRAEAARDCRSSMIDCPRTMVQRIVRANHAMIDDVRFTRGLGSIALERRCNGICAEAKRCSMSDIRWTLHRRMDSKRKHATAHACFTDESSPGTYLREAPSTLSPMVS